MSRILVVCPNISDVILGYGGLLNKHIKAGDDIRVMVLCDGLTSRASSLELGLQVVDLDVFEEQGRNALSVLGIHNIEFFRLPDNRLDQLPLLDIVKIIETTKIKYNPEIVYTTSDTDLGIDQKRTSLAVVTAFRPQPGENRAALYACEIISSTEWNYCERDQVFFPDTFIDISKELDLKLKAFQSMTLEQRSNNHARSIDAVSDHARLRGAQAGLDAAEALMLLRAVRNI